MSALPCINSMHADSYAAMRGREEVRDAKVTKLADCLQLDMWQDLHHLSDAAHDAIGKIGYYRETERSHPDCVKFLVLLRDGSDDIELARMLRAMSKAYIEESAIDTAEEMVPE